MVSIYNRPKIYNLGFNNKNHTILFNEIEVQNRVSQNKMLITSLSRKNYYFLILYHIRTHSFYIIKKL